jgi:hypothetical protein
MGITVERRLLLRDRDINGLTVAPDQDFHEAGHAAMVLQGRYSSGFIFTVIST